jgi:hypothetical protein
MEERLERKRGSAYLKCPDCPGKPFPLPLGECKAVGRRRDRLKMQPLAAAEETLDRQPTTGEAMMKVDVLGRP